MISVKNITYKIGKKILLDDVSADFEVGKLNLIIGPNGAGKSTLIKIICNAYVPQNSGFNNFMNTMSNNTYCTK